jgi:predicted GNAT family acetyltransferase
MAMIKDWLAIYVAETMNSPAAKIPGEVEMRYQRYVKAESHMCLMDGDRPLSMTGFNARLPGMVQIGGVFTPPEQRGRGLARRALALHLAKARDNGVTQATLFAASEAAASAYRAVGFQQVGDWTLFLLPEPEVAHG